MDSARSNPSALAENARAGTSEEQASLRKFLTATAVLLLCFSFPLYKLAVFALGSTFFSYILLIPVISGYLAWIEKPAFFPAGKRLSPGWAVTLWSGGAGLLIWAGLLFLDEGKPEPADFLALSMASLVLIEAGLACHFLGRQTLKHFVFPLGFLIFMAPFPSGVETTLETVLQHGSAAMAEAFFDLARMPVLRDGTFLQLPGFPMQVAPECSGIRSTMALFLTSLVAGKLFLRSPWRRSVLAVVVIPLAIVRNGFRVFVIGELCVQVDPKMIDSWIHHHGGPVFFALSLIPFSVILYFLYRSDPHPAPAALPPQN